MRVIMTLDGDLTVYEADVASCGYRGPENGGYQVGFDLSIENLMIWVTVGEDKEAGDKIVLEAAVNGYVDLRDIENVYIEDFSSDDGVLAEDINIQEQS